MVWIAEAGNLSTEKDATGSGNGLPTEYISYSLQNKLKIDLPAPESAILEVYVP